MICVRACVRACIGACVDCACVLCLRACVGARILCFLRLVRVECVEGVRALNACMQVRVCARACAVPRVCVCEHTAAHVRVFGFVCTRSWNGLSGIMQQTREVVQWRIHARPKIITLPPLCVSARICASMTWFVRFCVASLGFVLLKDCFERILQLANARQCDLQTCKPGLQLASTVMRTSSAQVFVMPLASCKPRFKQSIRRTNSELHVHRSSTAWSDVPPAGPVGAGLAAGGAFGNAVLGASWSCDGPAAGDAF